MNCLFCGELRLKLSHKGLESFFFYQVFYNLFISSFLIYLCGSGAKCMSVPSPVKQIKSMWTDDFGRFFIILSVLFIFAFPLSTASALSSTWPRHKKCQFSSKTTKALIWTVFGFGGEVHFELSLVMKSKKTYQQSPKVLTCSPLEYIPAYQFCTDYFILRMAGTHLNYLKQPAKNNRSGIIAHSSAGWRERKYTQLIQACIQ